MPDSANSARTWRPLPNLIFVLLLIASVSLAAGIGLRQPSPPDEPRFALAAKAMVESGDWLVPHRGRELYAEKPPVFMWAQAASYQAVRNWDVAFLVPSLLAALGTLWLTYDLARRLWGADAALFAAGALFVCVQFGLQAKRAQIDMVLVFLTTLSLWGLLRHLLRGPAWGALCVGAIAAGVGTVTKGVGFLPLLVLVPWAVARRWPTASPVTPGGWRWLLVPVGFLAGAAVWLGPLLTTLAASDDPGLRAYAAELFFKQTGERYTNAWHHIRPAWYYLQTIATLWLPLALLLPWLAPGWWRQLRDRAPETFVLLGWCLLVFLFFSASPGKREVYVFPILPALCIAAAPLLPERLARTGPRRALLGYVALFSLVLTALGASALLELSPWAHKLAAEREIGHEALRLLLVWLTATGVVGLGLAVTARLQYAALATVAFTAVLWTSYGVGLAPALDASSSARALMTRVGDRLGPTAELGMIAWREQNLLQADRPVVEFGFKQPWQAQWNEAATWLAAAPERRWIFVLKEAISPCVMPDRLVAAGRANRRDWVLVPGTALVPGCTTPPLPDEATD